MSATFIARRMLAALGLAIALFEMSLAVTVKPVWGGGIVATIAAVTALMALELWRAAEDY